MFECLFGYPPFWASTRPATQKIIIDWKKNLEIPLEPQTSDSAKALINVLLADAGDRYRTPTWEIDIAVQHGHRVSTLQAMQVLKKDVRNHYFFRSTGLDFERLHLMRAPPLPKGKPRVLSASCKYSQAKEGKVDRSAQAVKIKDAMLQDERVLKERRSKAFKNFTYRGPDIGAALEKFAKAMDNDAE